MKNQLRKLGHVARNRYTQVGAAVGTFALAGAANATEPATGGAAAITALETEAQTMIDAAWPLAILIVGAAIGIKLFKKFASKAS